MKTFCQQKAADSWRKAHMIEWLNLWQQIARKYSSFQFDQEKKHSIWELSAKQHHDMSASLHILCVIRQIRREGDPILTTVAYFTKEIFLDVTSLAARERCEISVEQYLLLWTKVTGARSSAVLLNCEILTKKKNHSGSLRYHLWQIYHRVKLY